VKTLKAWYSPYDVLFTAPKPKVYKHWSAGTILEFSLDQPNSST